MRQCDTSLALSFLVESESGSSFCWRMIFRELHGEDACVSNDGAEFADHNAAWKEMTGVCGDMIADISRQLSENAEWQMELLDEARKPVFRIRLVAETLQDTDQEAR